MRDGRKKGGKFQSTLPARGATIRLFVDIRYSSISIHAPRTGSDILPMPQGMPRHISIHAPRTGSDRYPYGIKAAEKTFQSTLPARGATTAGDGQNAGAGISIHAPRTGSDATVHGVLPRMCYFNPRSPHGERPAVIAAMRSAAQFQSTLPARGATAPCRRSAESAQISIHAPRTGSDPAVRAAAVLPRDFNPRSPHGERRLADGGHCAADSQFQSTLPARGATMPLILNVSANIISIHAPRTGSDAQRVLYKSAWARFQSTLPARGATMSAARR